MCERDAVAPDVSCTAEQRCSDSSFFESDSSPVRGGSGSGLPESTPARFCVFLSDPDPESKICEKPDQD